MRACPARKLEGAGGAENLRERRAFRRLCGSPYLNGRTAQATGEPIASIVDERANPPSNGKRPAACRQTSIARAQTQRRPSARLGLLVGGVNRFRISSRYRRILPTGGSSQKRTRTRNGDPCSTQQRSYEAPHSRVRTIPHTTMSPGVRHCRHIHHCSSGKDSYRLQETRSYTPHQGDQLRAFPKKPLQSLQNQNSASLSLPSWISRNDMSAVKRVVYSTTRCWKPFFAIGAYPRSYVLPEFHDFLVWAIPFACAGKLFYQLLGISHRTSENTTPFIWLVVAMTRHMLALAALMDPQHITLHFTITVIVRSDSARTPYFVATTTTAHSCRLSLFLCQRPGNSTR